MISMLMLINGVKDALMQRLINYVGKAGERMESKIEQAAFNQVEAAQYLGISDRTVRKMLKEGVIRCVQYGGRTFIAKAELDRFLAGGIEDEV
jgi:excisionase family DNA binding protein